MNPISRLNHVRGFTLIELMITVAVISVLAAIAYPSYRDSVLKARRGEGRAAINSTMQAEERFYSANNFYALTANGNFIGSNGFSTNSNSSGSSAYTITALGSTNACGGTTVSTQCVVVTATATQTDPLCNRMTMDSAGNKLSYDSSSALSTGCW